MSHHCSTLLLSCIDFRFHRDLDQWMDEQGLTKNYDHVAIAGACKSLVAPEVDRDRSFLLKQISISASLHNISQVFLMNHEDCGAYGGKKAFAGNQEEASRHIQEMATAQKIIAETHPGLQIKKIYARINDAGVVSF
ncbi:MAG: carbonic anhydrase, partial [Patescibacteria group bacterium]